MKRTHITLLVLLLVTTLSCGPRKTYLFNGKDLSGWAFCINPESDVPVSQVFGARDGVITISGQPFGYMMSETSLGDGQLHVEWRWVDEPSNSGIFLRCEPIGGLWPRCAEVNLMAGHAGDMISMGGSQFEELKEAGGIFKTSPHGESAENPAGEWNNADILLEGNFIQVRVNGILMNEAHFDRTEGPVALQSEGGPLEIRNVYFVPAKD